MNVKSKRCAHPGCATQPSYAYEGSTVAVMCAEHKATGMMEVKSRKCEIQGCIKQASYALKSDSKPRWCTDHKKVNSVDIKNKKAYPKKKKACAFEGCHTTPCFGFKGDKPTRCVKHMLDGMEDVVSRKCEICLEGKAMYGSLGGNALYCKECSVAFEGMVSKFKRECVYSGCTKSGNFYIIKSGESSRTLYCAEHKPKEALACARKCVEPGCELSANHGKPLMYCAEHCPLEVQKRIPKCLSCDKTASFGEIGGKKIYCADHADKNIHINLAANICDMCASCACKGYPGVKPTRCARHSVKGMIQLPTKRCSECKDLGTHEFEGKRYCADHAPVGAMNLALKKCEVCGLDDILNNDNVCASCDPAVVKKAWHAKEAQVKAFLDDAGVEYESADKMIDNGVCVKYRPDFVVDCGTHMLVIECDENQHKSYDPKCELVRMVNIAQAFGIQTVFIRYNPDKLKGADGKKVVTTLYRRRDTLIRWVKHCMEAEQAPAKHGAFATAIYLYYDFFDDTDVQYKVVTHLDILSKE